MASKARRRLLREGLEPPAPAARSQHAALPGTRAQRRRLRSQRRAERHQAEVAASGTASAAVPARYRADVPPPPGGLVVTLPLRPAVARTLAGEADRIGTDTDRYCTLILEQLACSVTRRGADDAADALPAPGPPEAEPGLVPPSGPSSSFPAIPAAYVGASATAAPRDPAPSAPADDPVALVPAETAVPASGLFRAFVEADTRRYWFPAAAAAALLLVVLAGAGIWNYGLVERYVFSGRAGDAVFLVDRWTGRVWTCTADAVASPTPTCRPVQLRAPASERVVATLGALD